MTAAHTLPLRFALRELRGGLRGFYVFIACIALGVMAIAGVGSLSASLGDGLAREARTLLGGDIAFSLFQREATAPERAFLDGHGQVTVAAQLRSMARDGDGTPALVEIKAVDAAYPLSGALELNPPQPLAEALADRGGGFGAAADETLLARMGGKIGDRVKVGDSEFTIRAVVKSEPDKLAGGIGFGPRFLISIEGLRATGLLQPGSLVRWTYRVLLPNNAADDGAAAQMESEAKAAFPEAGWDIRRRANASPQLERNISRFTQFLTLVGLAALLIGGVGVANAVRSHIERRRDVIATLKAVGGTSRDVFAIYLTQVMALAAGGSLIGLAAGAAIPFVVANVFGNLLPLPIAPALQPAELAMAFLYGLLTALAFGLWPLARVRSIAVAALFRDSVSAPSAWPRPRDFILSALVVAALIAVAIGLAHDRRIATVFVIAAAATFVLLRGVAAVVMAIARAAPHAKSTALRLAIANIHRPGALTPSVVLSLGLGLATLVTITQIDGNLRRQFLAALPDHAPSFYFIDIPSNEAQRFNDFLKAQRQQAAIEEVPMLRGRITAANGVPADKLKPKAETEWVLQSDRGLSYTNEVPRGSKVIEGAWWEPGHRGQPLVSLEKRIADGLGLKIGDTITVNVLGRNITATIANLRSVDWESLGINFVLVFTPNAFAGAPHTHIATLTEPHSTPAAEAALVKAVADRFPTVTAVRVREALESVGGVIANLTMAIRGASAVTLIAAILVLGGALAAGHRQRVYDAVILKTLGATRRRLLGAYALEYLLIGGATALFGMAAGSIAAWQIVSRLMHLGFVWEAGAAIAVVIVALLVTVGLGLAGTLRALNQKPARILRNL
ncbi:MAG TPA: ABC transporter permease [Xanthobacteraceae bacterium]|nr:ABC transporter permease [Xanthobacteraceae bacterium]HWW49269.1 ABC transporter permease [Xanthobacteraceae bacterium]